MRRGEERLDVLFHRDPADGQAKGKVDAPEQAPEEPTEGGGSMVATYQDASTPEALRGRELLEGDGALEDMADDAAALLAAMWKADQRHKLAAWAAR